MHAFLLEKGLLDLLAITKRETAYHETQLHTDFYTAGVAGLAHPTKGASPMFSLSTIATAMTSVAAAASASITVAEDIYKYGAQMISAAESAYSGADGSGATKKTAVLAALQAFTTALGQDWSKIVAQLSAWIDLVIAAYNTAAAAIAAIGASTPAEIGAAVVTAAVSAAAGAAAVAPVVSAANTQGV